jgi:hypothetical protein
MLRLSGSAQGSSGERDPMTDETESPAYRVARHLASSDLEGPPRFA